MSENVISRQLATDIALAWREIEHATNLLEKVDDVLKDKDNSDFRDSFGRPRGLQLGVPSGPSAHQLFDLPWTIAKPVIEAHIATQRARVAALSAQAVAEAAG